MIMESVPASNNRLEEIRREQASDPIIQELSRLCREGWTKKSKVRTHVLRFHTTSSSCLLIPSHQTVFLAHSRHFTIPWCTSCNLLRMSFCRTAGITKLVPFSKSPSWSANSHNKQSYLLVVDYYSRYNEIARLYSTSSNAVINHLKSIFARHRIPQTFISDNGPQYCGNA
jgi:transposase InsO family protein